MQETVYRVCFISEFGGLIWPSICYQQNNKLTVNILNWVNLISICTNFLKKKYTNFKNIFNHLLNSYMNLKLLNPHLNIAKI